MMYGSRIALSTTTKESHTLDEDCDMMRIVTAIMGSPCPACFLTWIHPMIPLNMMMVGGSGAIYHLDSLMVTLDLTLDIYIRY